MKELLFRSSWTSIVFEGRNKLYGAFELRQSYERNMALALLYTLFSTGAFTLCIVTVKSLAAPVTPKLIKDEERVVEWKTEPETYSTPKTQEVLRAIPSASKRKSFTSIAPDPVEAVAPATSTPMEVNTIAPSAVDLGQSGESSGTIPTETDGNGKLPCTTEIEASTETVSSAEVMPQFKGNIQSYIAYNFHYPSMAVGHQIEGKLLVEVILDENGKVSKAKILRSLGYGCDEEALRMVYAMPNWEPAKVGNRHVKIKMVIPIMLKLQ